MTQHAPAADSDSDSFPSPSGRSGVAGAAATVLGRWPTWLAVGVAAFTLSDVEDGTEFAFVLVVAAVGYLAVTVLERPRATWPLLVLLLGAVIALRLAGLDERAVLLTAGAALVVVGLARGSLRGPGPASLQGPAAVVFVGAGLTGTAVAPEAGLLVVAAGLIAHAAWDAYHWWADRIVVRSFAEWCGVLDLTLGIGILVLV